MNIEHSTLNIEVEAEEEKALSPKFEIRKE